MDIGNRGWAVPGILGLPVPVIPGRGGCSQDTADDGLAEVGKCPRGEDKPLVGD